MTTVLVPADPPRDGLVYPTLVEDTPLTAGEATQLYTATFSDICRAVVQSGGELLVNYRPTDLLPPEYQDPEMDSEAELRAVLEDAVDVDVEDVRFEVQVGSTTSARRGNSISHLLADEDVGSVAVLEPDAPLAFRTLVDSVAMALRRDPVVLAPGGNGSVAIAGFTTDLDFETAFEPPALISLTDRALDAGLSVDFANATTRLQTVADLRSILAEIQARDRADRIVPPHTTATIQDLGLEVTADGDDLRVSRRA